MNIVLIGTAYPYRGGLASFNERLALELQESGHEVTVYTFKLQYPTFLFPGKTQYAEEKLASPIKVLRKINSINPVNWIKIGNELKNNAPDLILIKFWIPFMGACFGTLLRRAKKNHKTRVISILDNLIPHERRPGDRLLTQYFLKPVDAFLSMSQKVETELKAMDAQKPKALNPHPIFDNFGKPVSRQEAAAHLNLSTDESYLLFFGIIRDYKGLDWLLKAYHQSAIKGKVKLLIAGEFYSKKEPYLNLIKELGLGKEVILHDHFINSSAVKYYFSLASVMVQPYKDATQSGVTQIAYQFSCPMIATNVGGLAEVIPDRKIGLIVDPKISSLTEALNEYFEKDLESVFRENFKSERKKYSWERFIQSILTLYHSISPYNSVQEV